MIALQYPEPEFRIKKENGKQFIFDRIRKCWLILTGEEWVRQNFVNYLIIRLNYPSTLIALEKEIWLNDLKKRFDILVYDKQYNPWMLVECKEPNVNLSEEALQQALRYNITMPASFIVVTNGITTLGWKKEAGNLKLLTELPVFGSL